MTTLLHIVMDYEYHVFFYRGSYIPVCHHFVFGNGESSWKTTSHDAQENSPCANGVFRHNSSRADYKSILS